jgi:hypothetical protein
MGVLLNPMISIGPIVFGLGLLFAFVCLVIQLLGPASTKKISRLRYAWGVLVTGVVAFMAGSALGIAAFCADASSGNLCGLGGVFGVGPIFSGIFMGRYAYLWLRDVPNAT